MIKSKVLRRACASHESSSARFKSKELSCGCGFQLVETVFDARLVGAQGEHIFAEDINLPNHLVRKLLQCIQMLFNFEYFGQRSLPNRFGFKRPSFSLIF